MSGRMRVWGVAAVLLWVPSIVFGGWVDHHNYRVNEDGGLVECLRCHNGSKAPAVGKCDNGKCEIYANHLVGVEYPPVGKWDKYAPPVELASRGMQLENGRVTCTSCHNLRNEARFHLAVREARENLCESCHVAI